jgi:hypothetical protein
MSISTMTAATLTEQIGEPVPDVYVLIAKNSVAGLDSTGIADVLGVTREEIEQVVQDQVYKSVRLLIASEYAKTQTEKDFTWDEIEHTALSNLAKRVPYEKDTESLLKIAAVANKAQRRNSNSSRVLDPTLGSGRVALTLSRRITERLAADGSKSTEETQQISVLDGSAKNPTFETIDGLLGVTRKPQLPENMAVKTHTPDDFSVDDLLNDLAGKARGRNA